MLLASTMSRVCLCTARVCCRAGCDRRVRQIHGPGSGSATPGKFAGSLAFLLQSLFTKLMQLGDLLADLLALGLFHFDQTHSAACDRVGRQLVKRHRHLAVIDDM